VEAPAGVPAAGGPAARAAGRPVWRPAWLNWTRTFWGPIVLAVVIVAVDQLTKWLIVRRFERDIWPFQDVLGDVVRLTYTLNSGAAFGLFPDKTIVFTLVGVAVVPILIWALGKVGDVPIARLSLGLLLGGTVGNLIDRIRTGAVVDFVDVGLGDLRWPAFNVADSAFVIGTIIMVAYILLDSEDEPVPVPLPAAVATATDHPPTPSQPGGHPT